MARMSAKSHTVNKMFYPGLLFTLARLHKSSKHAAVTLQAQKDMRLQEKTNTHVRAIDFNDSRGWLVCVCARVRCLHLAVSTPAFNSIPVGFFFFFFFPAFVLTQMCCYETKGRAFREPFNANLACFSSSWLCTRLQIHLGVVIFKM